MKFQRIAMYLATTLIVLLLSISGYGFYLSQQSNAFLATRTKSEAAERFARVQEVLEATGEKEKSTPTADAPARSPQEFSPETLELVDAIAEAEDVFGRFEKHLRSDAEWTEIQDHLLARSPSSWTEEDWQRLGAFLAAHEDFLADARILARTRAPLHPLDFSKGFSLSLPHLASTREVVQLLRANVLASARNGDVKTAVADAIAALRLPERLREDPLITSQLVGMGIESNLYEGISEAFPPGEIPPGLIQALSGPNDARERTDRLIEAHRMEEEFVLNHFEDTLGSELSLYVNPITRPWVHLDMQAYVRVMGEMEETVEMPHYEARRTLEGIEQQIEALPFTRIISNSVLPAMGGTHRAVARERTQRQLLLLGAAVESYTAEHGTHPPSLSAVGPASHGVSTIDPYTGAPFLYEVSDGGFRLYSVGPNLTDDGGNQNLNNGDIVWRGTQGR
jgi:hypothetical protein